MFFGAGENKGRPYVPSSNFVLVHKGQCIPSSKDRKPFGGVDEMKCCHSDSCRGSPTTKYYVRRNFRLLEFRAINPCSWGNHAEINPTTRYDQIVTGFRHRSNWNYKRETMKNIGFSMRKARFRSQLLEVESDRQRSGRGEQIQSLICTTRCYV